MNNEMNNAMVGLSKALNHYNNISEMNFKMAERKKQADFICSVLHKVIEISNDESKKKYYSARMKEIADDALNIEQKYLNSNTTIIDTIPADTPSNSIQNRSKRAKRKNKCSTVSEIIMDDVLNNHSEVTCDDGFKK